MKFKRGGKFPIGNFYVWQHYPIDSSKPYKQKNYDQVLLKIDI